MTMAGQRRERSLAIDASTLDRDNNDKGSRLRRACPPSGPLSWHHESAEIAKAREQVIRSLPTMEANTGPGATGFTPAPTETITAQAPMSFGGLHSPPSFHVIERLAGGTKRPSSKN
jgi:hypothetical protein